MAYGDKRDYPKIHLFRDGIYVATTTWAKNTREAVAKFWNSPANAKYAGYKITAQYDTPRHTYKACKVRRHRKAGR